MEWGDPGGASCIACHCSSFRKCACVLHGRQTPTELLTVHLTRFAPAGGKPWLHKVQLEVEPSTSIFAVLFQVPELCHVLLRGTLIRTSPRLGVQQAEPSVLQDSLCVTQLLGGGSGAHGQFSPLQRYELQYAEPQARAAVMGAHSLCAIPGSLSDSQASCAWALLYHSRVSLLWGWRVNAHWRPSLDQCMLQQAPSHLMSAHRSAACLPASICCSPQRPAMLLARLVSAAACQAQTATASAHKPGDGAGAEPALTHRIPQAARQSSGWALCARLGPTECLPPMTQGAVHMIRCHQTPSRCW